MDRCALVSRLRTRRFLWLSVPRDKRAFKEWHESCLQLYSAPCRTAPVSMTLAAVRSTRLYDSGSPKPNGGISGWKARCPPRL
eukprot:6961509-Prymnesium_polylepis.1